MSDADRAPREGAEAPFRWPPRRVAVEVAPARQERAGAVAKGAAPAVSAGRAAERAPTGAWAAFEREFLDVTAAPLAVRAVEASWRADEAGRYCARCGLGLAVGERAEEGCSRCAGIRFAWDRLVRLAAYRGPLRRWIHEVKFTRWRRLGTDLGRMLGHALVEARGDDRGGGRWVIVPVPDHGLRRVWRGIDHAAVIAAGAAEVTGWPVVQPLRRGLGRSQLAVPPSERARNVSRAYGLRAGADRILEGAAGVVVVDDVVTTGATMRACCRLVAKACGDGGKMRRKRVWGACLGRAEMEEAGGRGRR